jgi:phosphoribosylaminoimidazolecarboxamide formyltransferase / IMP cyclohydrolase
MRQTVIDQIKIQRALISVHDKQGLLPLAEKLVAIGAEILSTGGTAQYLQEHHIPVTSVSQVTGFPEILGGRVKTLHPHIHGAILAKRSDAAQMKELAAHAIPPIDMVVVNLYPFEKTVANPIVTLADAIENIDIGGPCMIRAAAKNFNGVAVITHPDQYALVLQELEHLHGHTSFPLREKLARAAFQRTCEYDAAISTWLQQYHQPEAAFFDDLNLNLHKVQDLRYGENPHQQAAFYRDGKCGAFGEQLHGKELSFNNILDTHSAAGLAGEFKEPCAIIVKHNNPCGAAVGNDLLEAYLKALQCDPVSAYGGVVGFNRTVDRALAEKMAELFLEVIIAPDFEATALELLKLKKNLRLLAWPDAKLRPGDIDIKKVIGGYLVQTVDLEPEDRPEYKIVSKRQPSEAERSAMAFGWQVGKWVKSNTIVFVTSDRTLGVGAGQMSRVDSAKIAVIKANQAGLNLKGTVAVSDAYFPFRDGIDTLAEAGATAVIQPGGSVRDEEVIAAADEHGMAMVFTGIRHFRH